MLQKNKNMIEISVIRKVVCFIVLFAWVVSCANEEEPPAERTLLFDKSKAKEIHFNDSLTTYVSLAFSDSTMLSLETEFYLCNKDYIVLDKKTSNLLRFDQKGELLNKIGKVGQGPAEYYEVRDINVNAASSLVQVLDISSVLNYTPEGVFVMKEKLSFPSSSFVSESDSCYWFYLPHGLEGKYSVVQTGGVYADVEKKYLPVGNCKIPIISKNFYKNGRFLTFKKLFENKLYRIENKQFINSYAIDFGDLQFPMELLELDPSTLNSRYANLSYAFVNKYFENNRYTFMKVIESVKNKTGNIYYWLVDKQTNEDKLFHIKGYSEGYYFLFPKLLSEDNYLCFLGYKDLKEVADKEDYMDKHNPSIYKVPISIFFNDTQKGDK